MTPRHGHFDYLFQCKHQLGSNTPKFASNEMVDQRFVKHVSWVFRALCGERSIDDKHTITHTHTDIQTYTQAL